MRKILARSLAVLACLSCLALFEQANAATIGDANTLGYFVPSLPNGEPFVASYLSQLIAMSPGSAPATIDPDNTIVRIGAASLTAGLTTSPGLALDLGADSTVDLGSGYTYLTAKYGGGNNPGGTVVWVVSGLSGEFVVPSTWDNPFDPSDRAYGLSGVRLWNSVPDGGATLMLLGCALSALGLIRQRLG